jgi:hypothetical protein
VFNLALRYFSIVLAQAWTYEARGPTKKHDGQLISTEGGENMKVERGLEVRSRLNFAIRVVFEGRNSGTKWEVRNVPPFDKRDTKRIPSRKEFLLKNTIRCVVCTILLDLISVAGRDTSQNDVLFDQSKVPLFSRMGEISAEDLLIRIISSLTTAVVTYLLFQALYSGSGVLAVALYINNVESWRPLFGDFSEIWSLRNTWK